MKFLANENVPVASIRILREQGYDVKAVIEEFRSVKDNEVIAIAKKEDRIIITFDKDYGELIYRLGMTPPGLIFLRFAPKTPEEPALQIMQMIVSEQVTLKGNYIVLAQDGVIRQKPLVLSRN